ncbi:DctP family TRAP transporter solute-binding subunit [Marinobacterium mangrovicola]|uniref:Tripartite ATP-independent transporter DctP family solute receptor n=1 Tax=Marinobacterium mangrovicola TaxID=1476959 RepID=A0A4R1GYH7_9GAMM|nr:DctP family TRAP transporter solute-binding subunit [Marinobacterium mangrovicola]TCK09552.1 tripartite ATP-independent transporter DctP family solute receptor [Marinobacterium mangrovicola]
MKFSKKTLATALATPLMAGLLSAQAFAADITLTLGHVDPPEWQTSKKGAATKVFKELVEAESGGRIEVNVYPNGQLGGETDLIQSAQDATLSMAMVSGAFSKVCKEAAVLDTPYLFPSAPVAWQVLDGQFGKDLSQHCLDKTGLRTLAYGETGFRNFTNSKRPISEPADLDGLKIRVMTVPLFVEMVKSMGGEPTPIAWPEVPSALSTGVVDGQENPVSVIAANKFYELQKYITLDNHIYGTDFLVINEAVYQGLDEKDRALVKRAAMIAGTVGRAIQQVNSAKGLGELAENGMEITSLTAEQQAKFQAAAQPAVVEWLKTEIEPEWVDKALDAVKAASAE